jgi:hypothetical protein
MVILALSATLLPAAEAKKVDLSARAKELVEKQVQDWKGEGFKLEVVSEKYLREAFPNHTFVAVHFPVWPVARVPAEPMKSQNLFAVSDDRKVTHLGDAKKLEEFFKATLKAPVNPGTATRGWLRLRMEYIQDGYYKFKFPEKTKDGPAASSVTIVYATVEVVPEMGNMGSFTATLRFNQGGHLVSLSEENKVLRGMRPRCQATLLLHPEKLVREIAEQDLLVMGSNAKGYLMEQRAKASAELRREIDRVWRRIVAEGR